MSLSTQDPLLLSLSLRLPLALAFACIVTAAGAQEADAGYYDGAWRAQLPCMQAGACSARLVLQDFEGTWQDVSAAVSKRACGGRKMPVTVQSSTRSQLAFTAFGDGKSMSCPTFSVFVRPIDEKTLAGTVDIGLRATEPAEVHAGHAEPGGVPPSPGAASSAKAIRLQRR